MILYTVIPNDIYFFKKLGLFFKGTVYLVFPFSQNRLVYV